MRKEYDFSKADRSPYAKKLRQAVTIRMATDTILYFKRLSKSTGMPYQTLINLYLQDCAATGRKLRLKWAAPARSRATATRKTPTP
ncbi:MAG: antitoxin [Candidatus Eisenbacteria bacterium]